MGRLFLEYLDADKVYSCKKCLTHFVDKEELISKVSQQKLLTNFVKNFHGKTGRAFLFNR